MFMKYLKDYKLFEEWGEDDTDYENDESTKELIEKAKQLYLSSKQDWFERTDLDEHFYGVSGESEFSDSDESYLQLFPQDLLDLIENNMGITDSTMSRLEAANILKGLKQDGYKIVKK